MFILLLLASLVSVNPRLELAQGTFSVSERPETAVDLTKSYPQPVIVRGEHINLDVVLAPPNGQADPCAEECRFSLTISDKRDPGVPSLSLCSSRRGVLHLDLYALIDPTRPKGRGTVTLTVLKGDTLLYLRRIPVEFR